MKRTALAAAFVLASGLIGALVVLIVGMPNAAPDVDAPRPRLISPAVVDTPASHIVSAYRVAVRFPDRFEFDRESDGEVVYWDPRTHTQIAFLVSRLREDAVYEDIVAAMERRFARRGVIQRREAISDTHVEMTTLEMFRRVTQAVIFVGESCSGKPLLVRAIYTYDRTESPQEVWITQADPDFPQFEFAYRCPR